MTQLKDLFETMATEVRTYDVAAPVMRAARRRRAVRLAMPFLAVAVAGLTVMVGSNLWLSNPDHVLDAAGPTGSQTLPWLPPSVISPEADPPLLPVDRAVGPGALLYAPCAVPCRPRLVTASGEQFTLAWSSEQPTVRRVPTLSPNGTWLSYPDAEGRYILRDLTTVRTLPTGFRRPLAWSPDGKFVVLDEPDAQQADGAVDVLSLADGTEKAVPKPALDSLTGMTANGDLVFGAIRDAEAGDIDITTVRTDGTITRTSLSTQAAMAFDEELANDLRLDPFAPAIVIQVYAKDGDRAAPADLLRVDLADKQVTRIRLPHPNFGTVKIGTKGDAEYHTQEGGDGRQLTNVLPEGVVLLYWEGPAPRVVELLDPVSGARSVITRFSGTVNWVRVRGDVDTR